MIPLSTIMVAENLYKVSAFVPNADNADVFIYFFVKDRHTDIYSILHIHTLTIF